MDAAPWVAVDVREYILPPFGSGRIECGDLLTIWIGGHQLRARAMDAGPLYRYYIAEFGPEVPIVVDIPAHLWPLEAGILSSRAVVVNTSAAAREMERWVRR